MAARTAEAAGTSGVGRLATLTCSAVSAFAPIASLARFGCRCGSRRRLRVDPSTGVRSTAATAAATATAVSAGLFRFAAAGVTSVAMRSWRRRCNSSRDHCVVSAHSGHTGGPNTSCSPGAARCLTS
jgi:hypothetical protein